MPSFYSLAAIFTLAFSQVNAALSSGYVGPLTTRAQKAAIKICNVLDYGAVADGVTDIGVPITSAWAACIAGGVVYIPPGTYALATWVNVKKGNKIAIQLDGTIVRTGTAGGNMIGISSTTDFEFFSGNSKGAIQGHGYEYISQGTYGARFIRFTKVNNFSIHGIALVDSPSYYYVFDTCTNGEIYNLILRGMKIGQTDGIDVFGENIWIHDVEVSNGDECVTVKSPSTNILIESVHCNRSGGCAVGSLGLETNISNIHYNNIYEYNAGGLYIKSYGGTGTMSNCSFNNFILHDSAYMLTNNAYWNKDSGGAGVKFTNLSYKNWVGTNLDNKRPVIRYICPTGVPCEGISIQDINLWTTDGDYVRWDCQEAFGTGGCLLPASATASATVYISRTITASPTKTGAKMPNDLTTAFNFSSSIAIPPIPTTFFPGLKPYSALLSLSTVVGRDRLETSYTPTTLVVSSIPTSSTAAPTGGMSAASQVTAVSDSDESTCE